MSRRDRINQQAEKAAMQASEAGRVLQAQRSEPEVSEKGPANIEPPRPRNEPRRLAMEEIEQRDLQSKADEGVDFKKEEPKAEPKEEPKVEAEAPKVEEPNKVEQAVETPAVVEPPALETVKVKVDGEEFDVPKAEIEEAGGIPAYRMLRAMENRLKKVNETAAQTKQAQAALAQYIQQQSQPPQKTPDQLIAEKIDVIRYGTPEESAAALREVLEKSNPRVDQNQITQLAVSKMHQTLAIERFKEEFADVVSNPMLLKLATAVEQERLSHGQVQDWPTFYRQIGNEIRSAIRPSQPTPTTGTPSQPSSDKEARKASIVNLPTAAARAELPKEEKPETREDVLNSMRKARGIPTG